uniref:putative uncharacterized protein DDB_G0282129 n=1 Tax=Erigeron canadensis TaxID=72917 RepID=UPI001CB8FF76|nr:putative uncharacterized protein DDB_G0282129 [Erigeron canadensis]
MKTKQYKRRKTKTKHRKPKYLSLSLQLTATTPQPPTPTTTTTTVDHHHDPKQQQLINLFPLHPENLMEQDKLDMASIFSSCDNDEANTTLTGILSCNNNNNININNNNNNSNEEDDEDVNTNNNNNPSPSSVNYADEEVQLVRTAMRRKNFKTERNDHDDEKWVYYSEVVEKKGVMMIKGLSSSSSSNTTTTNTTSYYHHNYDHQKHHKRSKLVLKLDYEKIMKSWVNKGPLYISDLDAPQPQTVPDLQDEDFFLPSSINGTNFEERDNGGGCWTVPEMKHIENNVTGKGNRDEELQAASLSAAMHHREASVQRYKEKRRNRLFTKTIRYEVRKLNAEKRPRIKGRFVKRI